MISDASWSNKLRTIGEIERPDHYYLGPDDQCAFFGEYTARKEWSHSTTNSIIKNLKKTPDKRGTAQWRYKEQEIARVAALIRSNLAPAAIHNLTFVPAPPSKTPTDPMYDDRVERIAQAIGNDLDVRCLLSTANNRVPAHNSDERPGPDALQQGLSWNQQEAARKPICPSIIILDDMLVTGATFIACSRLIRSAYPQVAIFGLFIARRVPERTLPYDDFEIEF